MSVSLGSLLWAYATWDGERDDVRTVAYALATPATPFDAVILAFDRNADEPGFLEGMTNLVNLLRTATKPVRVIGPEAQATHGNLSAYAPSLAALLDDVVLDTEALQIWAQVFGAPTLSKPVFGEGASAADVLHQAMIRARGVQALLGQRALYPKAKS